MTPWTDDAWTLFCGLVEEAWPGEFDANTRSKWRILLDGTDPNVMVSGLKRLLHEGRKWRPSASEFLEAANRDPSQPTFAEAYELIYGRHGALRAQAQQREFRDDAHRRSLHREAIRVRASGFHPLVVTFIERQGIERLQSLPVRHPEWGEKERRDLEKAWNRHVEAMQGRDVAALAAGGRRGEFDRFDPLTSLPGHASRPQIAGPGREAEAS